MPLWDVKHQANLSLIRQGNGPQLQALIRTPEPFFTKSQDGWSSYCIFFSCSTTDRTLDCFFVLFPYVNFVNSGKNAHFI